MWHGFDPHLWHQLDTIKRLSALQHQTPTKEWPLVFVEEQASLLVVREWPDGQVTASVVDDSNRRR